MTQTTDNNPVNHLDAVTVAPLRPLPDTDLQRQFRQAVVQERNPTSLLERSFTLLLERPQVLGCAWFEIADSGALRRGCERLDVELLCSDAFGDWLQEAALTVAEQQQVQVIPSPAIRHLVGICVPATLRGTAGVLAVAASAVNEATLATEVAVAQLVAAYLTIWEGREALDETSQHLRSAAVALELVGRVESSADLRAACYTVANTLHDFLRCEKVVVGICGKGSTCRVHAVSGMAQVDARSDSIRQLRAVLDETVVFAGLTTWPPVGDLQQAPALAHKQYARRDAGLLSFPLQSAEGDLIGAVTCLGSRAFVAEDRTRHFLQALSEPLGSALRAVQRSEGNALQRVMKKVLLSSGSSARLIAVTACAALAALMLLPLPYKIDCRCVAEPVQRRFCVAPQDGLLENTFVAPGDLVRQGDLLARVDGREIRWELAGNAAESHRAQKLKDAHLAKHEIPEALLAELEGERLQTRASLLKYRQRHLEIRSPIEGVVLSGNQERRENFPVTTGQVLYEIGPLDPIRMEIAVPSREIPHAEAGMGVELRFEGISQTIFTGAIARIRPRSELRDSSNVFVAEVEIENPNGTLRPGMKGYARVTSRTRCLGWILFHRPAEHLVTLCRW